MTAIVILAAGSSTRMGRPKALLELGGKTFVERIAQTARAAAIRDVMIAVSQDDSKIMKICELYDIEPVYNTATPTAVPLGSVHAAIARIINRKVDSLIVWPVDQPHVLPATPQALVSAYLRSDKPMVVPTFNGRRGHPALFGRAVFEEVMDAPVSQGARAVIRADPTRVLEIPVSDPAVLEDIDTPEAYRDLVRRYDSGVLPI